MLKDYLMVALSRAAEAEGCFLQVELVSGHCPIGLNLKAQPEGQESAFCQGLSNLTLVSKEGFEGSRHRLADSDSFFSNPRKFALWLASVMRSRKYQ